MRSKPNKIWFFQFNNGETSFVLEQTEAYNMAKHLEENERVTVYVPEVLIHTKESI